MRRAPDRIPGGVLAGLAATVPMTAVLEAASRLHLLDEPPPVRIVQHLLPGLSVGGTRAVATIAHLAYGGAVGALAAELAPRSALRRRATVTYALLVWLVSYEGWVPVAGVLPPAHRDRRSRALSILLAHVVYGLALRVRPRH